MSDLEAHIFVIALIVVFVVGPVFLIYKGIMRKWRASVALSPADARKVREIAATHFDDPLAGRIEWIPLVYGGSPRRAYRLARTGPRRLELRVITNFPSPKKVLIGVAIAIPLGVLEILAEGGTLADLREMFPFFLIVLGLIGLVVILGFWFSYRRAFDLDLGLFWSTFFRLSPCPRAVYGTPPDGRRRTPRCVRIGDIHSLQIISEKVEVPQGRKGLLGGYKKRPPDVFRSHELNLILKNGARVNVMDHGKLKSLRSDAQELSSFLGIPVWDSTGEWPELVESASDLPGKKPASSYQQRLLFLLDQSLQAANQAVVEGSSEEDHCQEALGWLERFLMSPAAFHPASVPKGWMTDVEQATRYLRAARPEEAVELLRKVRSQLEQLSSGVES